MFLRMSLVSVNVGRQRGTQGDAHEQEDEAWLHLDSLEMRSALQAVPEGSHDGVRPGLGNTFTQSRHCIGAEWTDQMYVDNRGKDQRRVFRDPLGNVGKRGAAPKNLDNTTRMFWFSVPVQELCELRWLRAVAGGSVPL